MKAESEQELTEAIEREIASGDFQKNLVPVENRSKRPPRAVYSVRLTAEEVREFEQAARERHQTLSEFLRAAGHVYLQGDRDVALTEARQKAKELSEALSRM